MTFIPANINYICLYRPYKSLQPFLFERRRNV